MQYKDTNDLFNEYDAFVVDRWFRDSVEFLTELGFNVEIPNFLYRLITKIRCVKKAVNGVIKNGSIFQELFLSRIYQILK